MISSGGQSNNSDDYGGVEFWSNPERTGWLTKQGEYIKTWRRRWFVLKQGKLFWFKDSDVTRVSRPRGVVPVASCLTAKGAEDVLNKQNAFELSTRDETMYFIADSEKEKEDWINSIGRSIVQNSRSVTDSELILLIPNFGLVGTCFVDWCVKFKNLCRNWLITANWFSSCDELV